MRLAYSDLPGFENGDSIKLITPAESELEFHNAMFDASHGCNACHKAHAYDTDYASASACLECHKDEHSLSYNSSPHGKERISLIEQGLPLTKSVSCATCHMPLVSAGKIKLEAGTVDANINSENSGVSIEHRSINLWRVQHNQNRNLRPNEKMIRSVCMDCHGLEFSIDALADEYLIRSNFSGKPTTHIESVDWAVERDKR